MGEGEGEGDTRFSLFSFCFTALNTISAMFVRINTGSGQYPEQYITSLCFFTFLRVSSSSSCCCARLESWSVCLQRW